MVLVVTKYDIHPDKFEAYVEWAQSVIPDLLALPGVVELRGYRTAAGSNQIVVSLEFATVADYAALIENETMNQITNKRRTFTINESTEVWTASVLTPRPLRPNG